MLQALGIPWHVRHLPGRGCLRATSQTPPRPATSARHRFARASRRDALATADDPASTPISSLFSSTSTSNRPATPFAPTSPPLSQQQLGGEPGPAALDSEYQAALQRAFEAGYQAGLAAAAAAAPRPPPASPPPAPQDTVQRSAAKGLTWRLFSTTYTVCIAAVILGDAIGFDDALQFGVLDFLSKFVLFFVHERIWALAPLP